ncbi:MAG: F0F1 ATP synthase subunit A [Butyribacter sp.]|nr:MULTISPECIES: F0F1 ATP synthase subunit A [Clostridia]MCQ5166376.1 F0F1 ATP synthase subunit A [Roseburia hominis]UYJ40852.1 MAG: F0F1 ATP synthase subunit A [Lachnospiraceae bacterium]CCZ40543.1 aTP synthase subunit a [Clostridium sp. CAG:122]
MGSDILNMSWVNSKALLAGGEVDFFIRGYTDKKFMFLGHEVYLTTTHISMIIVMAFLLVFALFANHAIKKADPKEAPGPFLNVVELIVEKLDGMVASSMGARNAVKFRNYVSALFLFILTCNLSGLLGLRPPTADFGVTFPLAVITWVMIQYNGFKYQKMGKIKGLFEPIFLFFPMNLISEFSTPVSMSLRLFGNILSGTVMMGLIYGLLPKVLTLVWPAALHVYLDVFSGCIQTYVFCMLTMCFVADAIGEDA